MDDLILIMEGSDDIDLVLDGSDDIVLTVESAETVPVPEYEGPYEYTPTRETQYVFGKRKVLIDNIRINPIPQNYGLITYNGNIITVS